KVLATRLSEVLRAEPTMHAHEESSYYPLLRLGGGERDVTSLFCVPGAGASVTSFADFVGSLPDGIRVYGLQPRGIDVADLPHIGVEAAAACNISALVGEEHPSGPVHLLGHSYGGAVAFEMAHR